MKNASLITNYESVSHGYTVRNTRIIRCQTLFFNVITNQSSFLEASETKIRTKDSNFTRARIQKGVDS